MPHKWKVRLIMEKFLLGTQVRSTVMRWPPLSFRAVFFPLPCSKPAALAGQWSSVWFQPLKTAAEIRAVLDAAAWSVCLESPITTLGPVNQVRGTCTASGCGLVVIGNHWLLNSKVIHRGVAHKINFKVVYTRFGVLWSAYAPRTIIFPGFLCLFSIVWCLWRVEWGKYVILPTSCKNHG